MNHKSVSVIKSSLRIGACIAVFFNASLIVFAVVFFLAEILGILEEVV